MFYQRFYCRLLYVDPFDLVLWSWTSSNL